MTATELEDPPPKAERLRLGPSREVNPRALYQEMGWNPHGGQLDVILTRIRNKVVAAGRRFGKSEIGGHKLCEEAVNTRLVKSRLLEMGKRREFWIVGPSYTDSEKEFRVVWNELKKYGLGEYFDKPGSYNDPINGNLHLSLWEGTFQVHAKSERHPDSLVGEGLSGAILAEAAKMKERTYAKLIRPTLADYSGWLLATSTPEGKNWFYKLWQMGQDPGRPDWASWRMPSWTNPFVYPDGASDTSIALMRQALALGAPLTPELCEVMGVDFEIGSLIGDLTEETFNQEIAALFTEFAGRVFKDFDEEVHVGDLEYNPDWATYGACDYGFTNPNVWLLIQVDPHGTRVNVLDEVYQENLAADEFGDLIVSRGLAPGSLREFYPDPASPGDSKIIARKIKARAMGGTGGELKWRLDAIRKGLKYMNPHLSWGHPERVPFLQFDRKCERTIQDMLNYRYPERKSEASGNAPELPLKLDDHGPEALGRFYAGKFGTADKMARRARNGRSNLAGRG